MKVDFEHHQTAHCENGVASNLLRNKGIEISEPMIFGIGSGLFFVYLPFLKVNFSPGFSYRPMPGTIFSKAAKRLGIKIKREKFSDPKKAQQMLEENLKSNIPTGLQVGVFNLTYFPEEYKFHFNAHNLVVYGKENGKFLISDPVMDFVTELSEAELEKVRFAKGALSPKGHMYYPIYVPENLHLEEAIKKGIRETCNKMLAPVPLIGVKAIRWVARNIPKWAEKKVQKPPITISVSSSECRKKSEPAVVDSDIFMAHFFRKLQMFFRMKSYVNSQKKLLQSVICGGILRLISHEFIKTETRNPTFTTTSQNRCSTLQIWRKLSTRN